MAAEIFKVSEVAHAFNVTPFTVRGWIKSGKLRAIKTGSPILIGLEDIREFIERTKSAAPKEPKVERKQ